MIKSGFKIMWGYVSILLLLCLSGLSSVAFAQGKIIGRVTDSDGNPVPGANVYISGPTMMANLSNARGYYVFLSVPQGSYVIKASKLGMPGWKNSLQVTSSRVLRQDIQLVVGSNKPSVNVVKQKAPEVVLQPDDKKRDVVLKPTLSNSAQKDKRYKAKVTEVALNAEEEAEPDSMMIMLAAEEVGTAAERVDIAEAFKEAEDAFAAMAVMPEAPAEIEGGISSIYNKIIYPEAAKRLRIEGKVVARVYVDSFGKAGRIDLMKPAHEVLNEEVFRVLTEQTKYKPAKVGARSVGSIIVIPIKFSLEN
ncbi:MAG: TonB family protein [Chlorobiales bacterium]|nr:TonB family protein [Chlorobiales bacterium]